MLHSHFNHYHHIPLSLTHHHHHHNHQNPLLHHIHHKSTKSFHIVSAVPPPVADSSSSWLITHFVSTTGSAIIELPSVSTTAPFVLTDGLSSTVQVAASVLLTGATAAFFFPSVLSRVKQAKQLKLRSSGVKKSKYRKAKVPPKPDQVLLGAMIAGVMALILYNMTNTIEAALSHQTISNNFSVRQVTITIRTMISGMCYLATFIYGFNCIGLSLYSGQLAINNFMEKEITKSKISENLTSNSDNNELSNMKEDQRPNKSQ